MYTFTEYVSTFFRCKNRTEEQSSIDHGILDRELANEECEATCQIKSYSGTYQTIKKDRSKAIGTTGTLKTKMNVRTIDVTEETRIYDIFSFVGTAGGSLSLFLGFSFYSIVEYIIQHLRELPEAL